jgi:hypothetical protein
MNPDAQSEPAGEHSAEHIVRHAGRRALGSRQRLRLVAIVLWSGFLGAVCLLIAWLALGRYLVDEPLTLDRTSAAFFIAWALALVPAGTAVLLATHGKPRPPDDEHFDRDR